MKICIHITSFDPNSRKIYLDQIIDEIEKYQFASNIFIHIPANVYNIKLPNYSNGSISIIEHDLQNQDPFFLAHKCRSLLFEQRNDYDIFMYIEDDILVKNDTIKYWLRFKDDLISEGYNLGFLRIEVDENNEFMLDICEKFKQENKIKIGNKYYINNIQNSYCGFWIYDKKTFQEWTKSNLYQIENISGYGIREASAIGLHGKQTPWYKGTLIPIIGNQFIPQCKIYHLTNNYVNFQNQCFSSILFDEAIENIHSDFVFLDDLKPESSHVSYGVLGLHGKLGYGDSPITVCGRKYFHAISAHAPSKIIYKLNGKYNTFSVLAAINDDVEPSYTSAEFQICVDGELIRSLSDVRSRESPRPININLKNAQELTLIINARPFEFCHTIWLEPCLKIKNRKSTITDCLGRAEIELPLVSHFAELCIATVVSAGHEHWVDDLFDSIHENGNCHDALFVVFYVGEAIIPDIIDNIAKKHNAIIIKCKPLNALKPDIKAILYSVAQTIDASKFICLDADMLVLNDLNPIFSSLDVLPDNSILVCKEACTVKNISDALKRLYWDSSYLPIIMEENEKKYLESSFVINDGIFAGTKKSLQNLDDIISNIPNRIDWINQQHIRNQFIFNLALLKGKCGVELDNKYNVQLCYQKADYIAPTLTKFGECYASILHFNGVAKHLRNQFQYK